MPTPCTASGSPAAGRPNCCAPATIGAAKMSPAIQNLLLRITRSLLGSRLRLDRCGRLLARLNIVQVIVRPEALGPQQGDGTVDRPSYRAGFLIPPSIAIQNVVFPRSQLLQL